ncbi:MAG: (4Fe-4S)-binding protein, partial [Sedimentitalea sp.]|nr:(4Fe-4S)-binding protein [Sedimentitalea sp.]
MADTLILCDCAGSQSLDAAALADACGLACSRVHSALCTDQIGAAEKAMAAGGAIIACQQERATFEALAEDLGIDAPGFIDLRDRAGWSDEGARAAPKMAALIAEARLPAARVQSLDVVSDGVCLIAGPGEVVLPLAEHLAGALAVSALITDGAELPLTRDFDALRGRIRRIGGALGGFEVVIDALQMIAPGGRGAFGLSAPRDGGISACDIVI